MPALDVRDKLVLPAVVAIFAAVVSTGLLKAAKASLFWAVTGGVAVLLIGLAVAVLSVRVAKLSRDLDAQRELVERSGSAMGSLSAELSRISARIAIVEEVAVPRWVSVAVSYLSDHGGTTSPVPSGLRFADREGVEVYLLPLPLQPVTENLHRHELYSRLGIGQTEYISALVAKSARGDG